MRKYLYTNRAHDRGVGFCCHMAKLPEFKTLPRKILIEAEDILDADKLYELQTGINPVKYKKHTPPILVSCL